MRPLTSEEKEFIKKFNKEWKQRVSKEDSLRRDIMRAGTNISNNNLSLIEDKIYEPGRESMTYKSEVLKYLKMHKSRGDYSSSDYCTYPGIWYSDKWTDTVHHLVDKAKNIEEESSVPGITYRNGKWRVNIFYKSKSFYLGAFDSECIAKEVLRKFNLSVTKRGYGVNYK